MDRLGAGMDFIFIYMDDILVASRDVESHLQHLRLLLEKLREFGFVLNVENCQFGRKEVDFLGHHISAAGAEPPSGCGRHPGVPEASGRQGPAILSRAGQLLQRFFPGAARILLPLTDALRGGRKSKLVWSEDMATAFSSAKLAVCQATQLSHPNPQASVSLAVDASDSHVGAVLQQREGVAWRPMSFFSKKLEPAQRRYWHSIGSYWRPTELCDTSGFC
jgi:hypothetical protein